MPGRFATRALRTLRTGVYKLLDGIYTSLDREQIRRTKNIRLIPGEPNRKGGKYSYAEWAHVIGIFQTLMYIHLDQKSDNAILDVGCGTGLLGIAGEPFLGDTGRYVGIDVMKDELRFCLEHYPSPKFSFLHLDVRNPAYSAGQASDRLPWDVSANGFDLVSALSVWTHLNEEDALFYFREISRVLKPGAKAIVTFFLLDEAYEKSLDTRSAAIGRYNMTPQDQWIFDQPAYGSSSWFCPEWAKVPEDAIGVTREGLLRLTSQTDLRQIRHYQGNWKEVPGVFFQDVVIFQKQK